MASLGAGLPVKFTYLFTLNGSAMKRASTRKKLYYTTASIPKCMISRHKGQGKAEREHRSCLSLPFIGIMAGFSVANHFGAVLLMRSLRYNVFATFTNNCLKICLKLLNGINDIFTH